MKLPYSSKSESINQSLYFETNTRREQHYRTKTGRHRQYVGLYFPFFGKLLLVCERLFNSGEINGRTVVGTAKGIQGLLIGRFIRLIPHSLL